ncbi:MAG: phosphomannomutase [Thermodesulfobacteriota bacterium]|nr:phosphomannomutase [Thermodesulfobacteriota bacterium]
MSETVRISDMMVESGVTFGTSGARGLADHMTDKVCYAYTGAFIQYLEEQKELAGEGVIAVGGDLRASTDRIMKAAVRAVLDRGYLPRSCGRLPSPALAHYGLVKGIPTIMVTGSHIPEDRNGIKYTKKKGEILKQDEAGIRRQEIALPQGLFDNKGMFPSKQADLTPDPEAIGLYVERYLRFFPHKALQGKRIGVYQHSAVGRDLMRTILSGLGAETMPLGLSEMFVPVDTEAIRPEDVAAAKQWMKDYEFDAIVSTDGDSDRPLISDEKGKWLRGDVAGILCSAYFKADAVATPVSCNSAVETCGLFQRVYRTRIGSPYVIEGMEQAVRDGFQRVVGYEANGGFLTASDMESEGHILTALPTRDAVILHIAILLLSIQKQKPISQLVLELPQRFTASNRLKDFPTEKSRARLSEFYIGDNVRDRAALEAVFGGHFGPVASIDATDGLRVTFKNHEIVHLRPSGNAPEFRCYNEADTESRAMQMNQICMEIMAGWRQAEWELDAGYWMGG